MSWKKSLVFACIGAVCVLTTVGCGGGSGSGGGNTVVSAPGLHEETSRSYYSPEFKHWGTFPIRVRFDGVTPDEQAAMEAGLNLWRNAIEGRIQYTVVKDASAQIIIQFGDLPNAQYGRTEVAANADETITAATITVSSSYRARLTPTLLARIVGHESGHALGMLTSTGGHSDHPGDLMYAHIPDGMVALSERDTNTVKEMYATTRKAAPVGTATQTIVYDCGF